MNSTELIKIFQSEKDLVEFRLQTEAIANEPEKWIFEDSLKESIIKIRLLSLSSPKLLNGKLLGLLAKKLINSEIDVGGPYISKNDIFTNILIAKLFRHLGIPLEKLEIFLSNKTYKTPSKSEKEVLKIFDIKSTVANSASNKNKSFTLAKKITRKLDSSISSQGLDFLKKIERIDKNNEISSISRYLLLSLKAQSSENLVSIADTFGAANLFAWIAYTIYDDFIDDEGNPCDLSLANTMHRLSYSMYIENNSLYKSRVDSYFNSVDNANLWELRHCRFVTINNNINIDQIPDYKSGEILADRAIGHLLGPKLIFDMHPYVSSSQEELLDKALSEYLISKQINDDLHDWRSDLRNGHISYVVAKLLATANIKKGKYNIDILTEILEKVFWETTFKECARTAISKMITAEADINKTELFIKDSIFHREIILPLKKANESTLEEYINGKTFLNTYKQHD